MEIHQYLERTFWESRKAIALGGKANQVLAKLKQELPNGAILFSTSGSSGEEKWVVHTRKSLLASARSVNAHLEVCENDIFGNTLPLHHVGGMGVIARAYESKGGYVSGPKKWNPHEVVDFFRQENVTITSLVPTQVYDLVRQKRQAPPGLRAVVVGGGELSEALGKQARALGWNVLPSYGLTEAGSQVATAKLDALSQPYTNEKLPILPIWNAEQEAGRLKLSGEALCSGIVKKNKEGYFFSSVGRALVTYDYVELYQGLLTFVKRVDRVVKIKGELVDLDAIEKALYEKYQIEIVLLPEQEARDGFRLVAFAKKDLLKQVRAQLPKYVELARWVLVQEIPRSELGKVDRKELKKWLR